MRQGNRRGQPRLNPAHGKRHRCHCSSGRRLPAVRSLPGSWINLAQFREKH